MLPEVPDFRSRAALREYLDEPCGRDVLRAYLRDLEKVNRWLPGYRRVLDWLDGFAAGSDAKVLRILDVGCGYGDGCVASSDGRKIAALGYADTRQDACAWDGQNRNDRTQGD